MMLLASWRLPTDAALAFAALAPGSLMNEFLKLPFFRRTRPAGLLTLTEVWLGYFLEVVTVASGSLRARRSSKAWSPVLAPILARRLLRNSALSTSWPPPSPRNCDLMAFSE